LVNGKCILFTDELDETTPLPELTFYDLLEPTTSKEQQVNAAADAVNDDGEDDDGIDEANVDEGGEEEFLSVSVNDSLNTPRTKKAPTVRILENKRLSGPAPIGTALKNMLGGPIKVISAQPTKPATQVTEVKILNKLQAQPLKTFGSAPIKIGSTTIAAPAGAATAAAGASPKSFSGVTMTQIKTADGKVLFVQKSLPGAGGAAPKVTVTGAPSATRVLNQSSTATTTATVSGGIRQTVLPKGVTLTSAGQIKTSAGSQIVRGLTTIGATKSMAPQQTTTTTVNVATAATTSPTVVTNSVPIKVVRTPDGKLIKLNHATSSMVLNTKPATVAVRTAVGSAPTTVATASPSSSSNVVVNKPTAQVIIKVSVTTTAAAAAGATSGAASAVPAGKMLVEGTTGKQIVVATKNIIKLSPSTATTTATTPAITTPSGLHAIQLPGKSGLQYVRVLPSSNSSTTTTTTTNSGGNKVVTSPQKVSLGRPRTGSNSNSNSNSKPSTQTVSVSNTSKIVMKTMGGSIVPLPSMHTLVPRRVPGTPSSKPVGKPSSSLDAARKHRLSDLNVQIKQLSNEAGSEAGGPEAKKARYVIAMPHTSTSSSSAASAITGSTTTSASQQQQLKLAAARPTQVQRVTVQGANANANTNASASASGSGSGSSSSATRKVFNLVTKSDANGVKYMICNKSAEGKPRTVFNTTMRRGYTLADTKLRRPMAMAQQQMRFKQIKMQQRQAAMAHAQVKLRQQQQQKPQQPQASAKAKTSQQQQQQPQQQAQQQQQAAQSTSTQAKSGVPGKPLFDILKPPPAPAPAAAAALDALGGSRRKHCNCSKSQCLKLYCDCFANGEFCQDCTCKDCFNNLDYEVKREHAIRSCLERNPSAFKPKITAPNSGDMRLHNKGCNCKRSGCLKNYCECYEAKIPCSAMCKCVGCRNMEDRPDVDMDTMDSLADVKQNPRKIKDLNASQPQDNRSNAYLTDDVIEATIMCMISRIVMNEKQNMPIEETEREVMEELGESLNQIITFAKEKNDTIQTDDPKTTA
ncbi:hypothetical protein KR222_010873, partial [Zaprionus bogoriensis]